MDSYVEFALRNNMKITGLHLLWGAPEHLPYWLINGNFNNDELKAILENYIRTIAGRYKGKIYAWSIANEYASRLIWGGDFFRKKLGEEYVPFAFNIAHETDPNALLILNQDSNESMVGQNAMIVNQMLSLSQKWKDSGVPIDAIGMQMHLSIGSGRKVPTKEELIDTMHKFSDLGFPVLITEFDVSLQDLSGTTEEKFKAQAEDYREMLAGCIESGVCKEFNMFGILDSNSWYVVDPSLRLLNSAPDTFDASYQPKPSYFALLDVLKSWSTQK